MENPGRSETRQRTRTGDLWQQALSSYQQQQEQYAYHPAAEAVEEQFDEQKVEKKAAVIDIDNANDDGKQPYQYNIHRSGSSFSTDEKEETQKTKEDS